MYTEDEAKTKWCPFVRIGHWMGSGDGPRVGVSANRVTPMDYECKYIASECKCIASECMAWRKIEPNDTRKKKLVRKDTGESVTSGYSWETEFIPENPNNPPPTPVGYCGLAGKFR